MLCLNQLPQAHINNENSNVYARGVGEGRMAIKHFKCVLSRYKVPEHGNKDLDQISNRNWYNCNCIK